MSAVRDTGDQAEHTPPEARVTVITGLSGAGRSEAAAALEDLGWFVVDNLPPALIQTMLSLAFAPGNRIDRVALVIDARGGSFFDEAADAVARLRRSLPQFRLVFLTASDEALVRRFDATRRRHPLAPDGRVVDGIKAERELMSPLQDVADLIVDTSDLSVHELRARMARSFEQDAPETLTATMISFGYKHGVPVDADMVFDARFLPNPHWVPELRSLSGRDEPVRDYVMSQPGAEAFVRSVVDLLALLLPGYRREGRHYLTVAIGCTGGRHRSVVLAEELARRLTAQVGLPCRVTHRDVDEQPAA